MSNETNEKNINVSLPGSMHRALRIAALQHGMTMAGAVREAIALWTQTMRQPRKADRRTTTTDE